MNYQEVVTPYSEMLVIRRAETFGILSVENFPVDTFFKLLNICHPGLSNKTLKTPLTNLESSSHILLFPLA
jgi:hypothetical protein